MKFLQDLVPGCSKVILIEPVALEVIVFILTTILCSVVLKIDLFLQVTGKAVMLDEIINYVQSLQRQVEVWELNVFNFYQRM